MADRAVNVNLRANVTNYTAQVERAENETERLRIQAERFDGKSYTAKLEVDTKAAQADVDRLRKRIEQDTPQLDLDIRAAELKAVKLERDLAKLKAVKTTPEVELKIAKAEAALGKLNTQLETLHNKRVTPEIRTEFAAAQAKLAAFTAELNRVDGMDVTATVNVNTTRSLANVKTLAAGLAVIGPAAAGGAAVAAGAVGGLTTVLAVTAAAGVSAALAFDGIGDAVSAANAYALEPTAENLEKLNKSMGKLTVQGQSFAKTVASLTPELNKLKATAQTNMLPGLEEGLKSATVVLPAVNNLVAKTSEALGKLGRDGGAALKDPFWTEYFNFLADEAGPTLDALGTFLGNTAKGFAGLSQAFAPVSRDMVTGLKNMSTEFANWSTTLESNQGFQEFIAYVRENGPLLKDTIGSVVIALGTLVEAAAPIAPVVLTAIKGLADGFAALMGSDFGPWAVGIAASLGALVLASKGINGAAGGIARMGSALSLLGVNGRAAQSGAIAAAGGMTRAGGAAGTATGSTSRFGAAAGAVGRNLPIVGAALIVAAAGFDTINTSSAEAAEGMTATGRAAFDFRDELRQNDAEAKRNTDTLGEFAGGILNWKNELIRGTSTTAEARAALDALRATMTPLQRATDIAAEAQANYDDTVIRFGQNSPQAVAAAGALANANADAAVQTELANKSGVAFYQTLGQMAGQAGPAGDAAGRLASGLKMAEVSAMGATVQISSTGQAVATLPDGKQIILKADGASALTQIQAVSTSLDKVAVGKTVNVGVIGGPAIAVLNNIQGVKTRVLENGTVEVTAETAQAQASIQALGNFANEQQMNPTLNVNTEPGRARLIQLINEANAARGLPLIDANTDMGRAAVDQLIAAANQSQPGPGVGANTAFGTGAVTTLQNFANAPQPGPSVGANTAPGEVPVLGLHGLANTPQPGPSVGSDVGPGLAEVQGLFNTARTPQTFPENANTAPAAGAVAGVQSTARLPQTMPHLGNNADAMAKVRDSQNLARQRETMPVDAETGGARGVISDLRSFASRAVSFVVNAVRGNAAGALYQPMADGGLVGRDMVAHAAGHNYDTSPYNRSYGDKKLRQMPGGGARMVNPNTWRVVGDRMDVPELYAPLDGSGRSLQLIAQGAASFGKTLVDRSAIMASEMRRHVPTPTPAVPRGVNVPQIMAMAGASRGDHNVTINAPVHNPVAERGSDSVQSTLSRLADLGLFADA